MGVDSPWPPGLDPAGHDQVFLPAAPVAGGRWFTVILVILLLTSLSVPALLFHEAWAFSTLTYRVDEQGVKIHHGLRRITIPHEAVTAVTIHDPPPRLGRVAGTSLGGYRVGWFSGAQGRIYLVAVGANPLVVLDTTLGAGPDKEGRRYGLTPADPEGFARSLGQRPGSAPADMPGGRADGTAGATRAAAGGEVVFLPAQSAGPGPARAFLGFLAAIAIPLVVACGLALWFGGGGPRHLRYILGPEGITVQSRWLKRHLAWDRVTGITPFQEKMQGWRVMGFAVPGYYIGSFRFKGLGNAQVFATTLKGPGVILTTAKGPWMLTPADVDGFVAAATAMMARG